MTITDELLDDLISAAVEGGINYWAHIIRPRKDGTVLVKYDGSVNGRLLTRDVVRAGLTLVLAGTRLQYATTAQLLRDDAWDAGDADVVVQLGLFGDVIYG